MSENFSCWHFDQAHKTYTGKAPVIIKEELASGYYSITTNMYDEPLFELLSLRDDKICNFVSGPSDDIYNEVTSFWESNDTYKKIGITHKRGILLYGPPGCGKSAIIARIIKDIIAKKGIAIDFNKSDDFFDNIEMFRQIQPETPIVVIIEDLDSFRDHQEEELCELLDGQSSVGHKILYLATTNYLDKISNRIKCRPSRIDTLIKVGFPAHEVREEYVRFLIPDISQEIVDAINKCEYKLSIADIKEILISVYVHKKTLKTSIERVGNCKSIKDKD